jgi:cytosine/adenosine deaminase-related metal-dependent hydrolase
MVRIGLAPCSLYEVTPSLMRETLRLAEEEDLLLHTHLCETRDEVLFCRERFGRNPVDLMDDLGWLTPRTWFAHFIHLTEDELTKAGRAGVGMSYCSSSNMRLASGIAPIGPLQAAGVRTSIGIDGSASNDMNNMVLEMRTGLLLQRLRDGAGSMTPLQILSMATREGAAVLGRGQEIGSLEIGKAADLVGFRLDTLELAGGLDDPLGALLFCDVKGADLCLVNGEVLIRNGELQRWDAEELEAIIRCQNRNSRKLIRGE